MSGPVLPWGVATALTIGFALAMYGAWRIVADVSRLAWIRGSSETQEPLGESGRIKGEEVK